MIENLNKIEGAEEAENVPLGMRLIAKADCKSCHNTYVQTVGPAYVDIAKRYNNTADNSSYEGCAKNRRVAFVKQ